MARTKKSRGVSAFQMRSGNRPSPHKFGFLKNLALGPMGAMASNMLGGRGGGGGPQSQLRSAGPMSGGGGGPMGGGQMGPGMLAQGLQQKFGGGGMGGMRGGPMAKKEAPYKRIACAKRSPMKAADTGLIRAYSDAMRGHGQIVKTIKGKTKSITEIGASLGEIFAKKSKRGSTRK